MEEHELHQRKHIFLLCMYIIVLLPDLVILFFFIPFFFILPSPKVMFKVGMKQKL